MINIIIYVEEFHDDYMTFLFFFNIVCLHFKRKLRGRILFSYFLFPYTIQVFTA